MKRLIKPNEDILRLVSQSVPSKETRMKRSQFVIPFHLEEHCVYYNTLTGECYLMEGDELLPASYLYTVNEQNLTDLIKSRFYVREEIDEVRSYCGFLSILRTIKYSQDIRKYTILPTSHCNARCFYCFEKGFRYVAMTDDTVRKTVDLIERTHGNSKVTISWFGGEPLMGIANIRRIVSALKEKEIPYKSTMVSNGSLFTDALVNEAKTDWKLESVQITLDGNKSEYLKRKNYVNQDDSVFDKVLENIRLLQNAGTAIRIRLNIDRDNILSCLELADILDEYFPIKKGITVKAAVLFQNEENESGLQIWKEALKVERVFHDKGFKTFTEEGFSCAQPYYCMADSPDAVVINADGTLYACEHCDEGNRICNIDNFISKNTKKTAAVSDIREKCLDCPFLPNCTDFSNCPSQRNNCREIRFVRLEAALRLKLETFLKQGIT